MMKPLLIGFILLLVVNAYSVDLVLDEYFITSHSETLEIIDTISSFPYLQSFEGTHFWIVGGQNPSWQLGIPNNTLINSASSGQKAWVTGLSTPYNSYEKSWVESPVFDFSLLVSPRIKFDIMFHSEDYEDGACFEYSLDNGSTWASVGQYGDPDYWYNSYFVANLFMTNSLHGWTSNLFNIWKEAEHDLSFLGGQSSVKFRFYFGASQNLNSLEGFGFDNIVISDLVPSDIGVSDVLFPTNDCILSDLENVIVEVTNYGTLSTSGFMVSYQFNGNPSVTESFTGNLLSGESYAFEFSTPIDISSPGLVNLFITVIMTSDMAAYNDTLTYFLNLDIPLTLPWSENFESGTLPVGWSLVQEGGSDGWLVGTNLGSTYFDIPPHTYYIASNDDTCYCDMSNDMLITPAFDFSVFSEVTLEFDSYINGFYGSSGKILASINCGYTWELVQFVQADTFYWQSQVVDLSAYGGESSVKIAFHHNDNGVWAAGFAVDNVSLQGVLYSETQVIELIDGWGLMSTNLDPLIPSIDSVFSGVKDSLEIVKNGAGDIYWPAYNLNLIGNNIVGEGYQYNMNSADTMEVYGIPVIPELVEINLPIGWSILGYIRNNSELADVLLNSISSNIDIMKDENGEVYWPLYNLNMIGLMKPGKGYQINMISPVTYIYPPN